MKFSKPCRIRLPAPEFGQHTEESPREGYDWKKIIQLRRKGYLKILGEEYANGSNHYSWTYCQRMWLLWSLLSQSCIVITGEKVSPEGFWYRSSTPREMQRCEFAVRCAQNLQLKFIKSKQKGKRKEDRRPNAGNSSMERILFKKWAVERQPWLRAAMLLRYPSLLRTRRLNGFSKVSKMGGLLFKPIRSQCDQYGLWRQPWKRVITSIRTRLGLMQEGIANLVLQNCPVWLSWFKRRDPGHQCSHAQADYLSATRGGGEVVIEISSWLQPRPGDCDLVNWPSIWLINTNPVVILSDALIVISWNPWVERVEVRFPAGEGMGRPREGATEWKETSLCHFAAVVQGRNLIPHDEFCQTLYDKVEKMNLK